MTLNELNYLPISCYSKALNYFQEILDFCIFLHDILMLGLVT